MKRVTYKLASTASLFQLRLPRFISCFFLGLTCAVAIASSSNAEVITFDETVNTNPNGFETQGFIFDITTNHYHLESTTMRYGMSSPTLSLIIDDSAGSNSLSVASGVFGLKSLDIASQSASWGSTTVTIAGTLSGGGNVNHIYNDSDDSAFENLVLNWTNLTSVSFTGSGNSGSGNNNWFRLDNINVPDPIEIALDIKPGSFPNSVNLKSKGVLPVAILGTDVFDVSEVDFSTLLFGDPLLIDDGLFFVDGRAAVSPLRSALEDVNDDGFVDLTLKFSIPDLVEYEALGPHTLEGLLTGETVDGIPFSGMDSIRIVPPNRSNGNHLQISAVPEPSTLALTVLGLLGIGWRRRKRV